MSKVTGIARLASSASVAMASSPTMTAGANSLTNDVVDLAQRRILIAGVGLTDNARVRVHASDQRRAMCHVVMTALKVGA